MGDSLTPALWTAAGFFKRRSFGKNKTAAQALGRLDLESAFKGFGNVLQVREDLLFRQVNLLGQIPGGPAALAQKFYNGFTRC